jgi:polyisoprenoid-binding protein YceI
MRHARLARAFPAVLALVLFADGAARAEARSYAIDAARSEVRFSFRSPRHTTTGRTHAIAGRASLAPGTGGLVAGSARVEAASLDTGNGLRDRKMRSMLRVKEHPEIVFRAESLTASGPGGGPAWRGALAGDLTVRGVTRPVTFEVEGRWEGVELHARGSSRIRFTDFGMKPPKVLGILRASDEIAIAFDVVAVPAPPAPPAR